MLNTAQVTTIYVILMLPQHNLEIEYKIENKLLGDYSSRELLPVIS